MKRTATLLALLSAVLLLTAQNPSDLPFGTAVSWDRHSLLIDGRRVCPVMGEIHYSRVPADEWAAEVRKMRQGGVTIIATYVFWNHIEEEEGIFRWDGQRNLRRFLEICRAEGMPVVLRLGPWCHGEVRNGGLPEWLFAKGCKVRSEDSTFLASAERLYRQIFTQVQGLQWKDGGPVVAAQFDNEYRGPASYLLALKRLALGIGFDLPFYTRTGWPELTTPMPFGEMLPLYGDYADGFWDKSTGEGVGNYYQAFNFKSFRSSTAIGTDFLSYSKDTTLAPSPLAYPYFTCELGGGMATAYHRRPYIYAEDAYSMALVKLGSGSNLLGYYMYHGGTNPEGRLHPLNECQTSPFTANNDLPVCTYDFQAPLGEFGQKNPQYYTLRPLHLFMHDFGELLAPLEARFPGPQELKRGEDKALRWSLRSNDTTAFLFINNYERFCPLSPKRGVCLEACGVRLPRLTIPAGCMAIFPVNLPLPDGHLLNYATAQPVAWRDGALWFEQKAGIPALFCIDGKERKVKAPDSRQPFATFGGTALYLITPQEAEHLFLPAEAEAEPARKVSLPFAKTRAAGPLRTITKGRAKVAAAPAEKDWEEAAVYRIDLSALNPENEPERNLLSITYRGDCARLYANGRLVADNFYYGRPFLFGLWRLPAACSELELRILPLQPDAPLYLPREADKHPGEAVSAIEVSQP